MRIVVANLRLFYLNSRLWYIYAVFVGWIVLGAVFLDVATVWNDMFGAMLLGTFSVGLFVGAVQGDVALHPMCQLLPGPCRAMRRTIFGLGTIVCLALVLILVAFHGKHLGRPAQALSTLISAFSILFAIYLAGAMGGVHTVPEISWLIPFVVLFAWSLGNEFGSTEVSRSVWNAVTGFIGSLHPAATILLGIAGTLTAWWYFGRFDRLRAHWESDLEDDDDVEAASFDPESFLKRLCLRQMAKAGRSHQWKYAWGTLYMLPLRGKARIFSFECITYIILASYVPEPWRVLPLILCINPTQEAEMPLLWRLFPTAGRRQRYFATMFAVGVAWIRSIVRTATIILGAGLVACIGPTISAYEIRLSAEPVEPRYLCIPLVATPLWALCQALLHRNPPAAISLFLMIVSVGLWVMMVLNTVSLVMVAACVWLLLARLVHGIALGRDIIMRRKD